MNTTEKQAIQEQLRNYVAKFSSQNKAANSLKDISSATVSQILNDNWEKVSDEMWRKVDKQTRLTPQGWVTVETSAFKLITKLIGDAQQFSNVLAITGGAGSGKSVAIKQYSNENKNAILLQCSEFWNRKYFLAELLSQMGRDYSGLTVSEMMQESIRVIQTLENPVIILDEADKLTDQVLYFFITLYNHLEDHCGIVLLATDHLAKRIRKGMKLNRKGYNEIYSRIGRKFIELKGTNYTDVTQVCMANGVADKAKIEQIFKDAEGDLRRVKRLIHADKMKQQAA